MSSSSDGVLHPGVLHRHLGGDLAQSPGREQGPLNLGIFPIHPVALKGLRPGHSALICLRAWSLLPQLPPPPHTAGVRGGAPGPATRGGAGLGSPCTSTE